MATIAWAALSAIASLWPGRLAGPIDGVPLDQPLEAILLGLALWWLVATDPSVLRRRAVRGVVAVLLGWKAVTSAVVVQDGWCLRFTSPVPIYRGGVTVPHSWDVRADWRSPVPRCSAIMSEPYPVNDRFPAWFFNLPPEDPGRQATASDRPPNVATGLALDGFLRVSREGTFRVALGPDVHVTTLVDGHRFDGGTIAAGVVLSPGLHRVSIQGELLGSRWRLEPFWNDAPVWRGAVATLMPPRTVDLLVRPWGRWVAPLLVAVFLGLGLASVVERVASRTAKVWTLALSAVMVGIVALDRGWLARAACVLLAGALALALPRRLQNTFGVSWLIGVPLLALVAALGWSRAGMFTLYSSGDDFWMFQRFAYRIYLQGYWLEGGEPTFWFQPFYRWIAGALHLVFGDSSVGELFWDAACALAGALFSFHLTKQAAGFRWGAAAAVGTLAVFLLGPGWYLLGRGLSEFSSMGLLSAAGLMVIRAKHGYWPAAAAAAVLATLAVYTRLNNLPMALSLAVLALPARMPVAELWRPRGWLARASRPAALAVLGGLSLGLWLFTARTYYYTRVLNMFYRTTAALNSVWQAGDSIGDAILRVGSSVLMVLTMNDPPRADIRALPIVTGCAAALLGLVRVGRFAYLPVGVVAIGLAGVSSAFVARGVAYPGRFSIHLVPIMVALSCCAVAMVAPRRRGGTAASRVEPRAAAPVRAPVA